MFAQSFCGPLHFLTHIRPIGSAVLAPEEMIFGRQTQTKAPPVRWSWPADKKVRGHGCGLAWKDVVLLSSTSAPSSCLLGPHPPSLTTYCDCRVAISSPQMGHKSDSSAAAVAATVALHWSEHLALQNPPSGIQHPQREVSEWGQKVKKWNGSGPVEGGWRSSCHEHHFGFRWMSAFEPREVDPAKQNTPLLNHLSTSSPLSGSLIVSGGYVIAYLFE